MKGLKKGKVRYLILALALCLITASGVGVYTLMENKDKADAATAAPAAPAITYDVAADAVTAKLGTAAYKFYTTANASKKVPTPNNWIPTDSGKVDMSYFTTAKTLYFANSTSPALEDIATVNVPAAPVLAKAAYAPNNSGDISTMFSFQTNLNVEVTTTVKEQPKITTKAVKVDVPLSRMQYRINDSGAWMDFARTVDKNGSVTAYNLTIAELDKVQKEGGTIYVRVKAGTSKVETVGSISTVTDSTTAFTLPTADSLKANKVDSTNNVVRVGVSKVLKIAKRPAAPAVSIDYANHCVTLKSTQQYNETDSYAAPTAWKEVAKPDTAKPTATSWTNKIYFGTKGNMTADKTLVVRNVGSAKALDSHSTYVEIAKTPDFVGTATVQGAYKGAATLQIKATEEKKGIAYQYAIVDLNSDDFKDLITYDATAKGVFDYTNAKVKWSNVSTDVTGTAKASLAWAKVSGKQVIVRKAAVAAAKEFSSKVIIFEAPKGENAAPKALADATPMNCWTKLAQSAMTKAIVLNDTGISYTTAGIALCANATTPVYDVSTKKISFTMVGCKTVPNAATLGTLMVKSGKVECDASATGCVTAAVDNTNNVKVTIDTTKLTALPTSDKTTLSITVPAGFITDAAGAASVQYALTCTFDNKAPTIKSAVFDKKTIGTAGSNNSVNPTLVITFDSPMAVKGEALVKNGTVDAANLTFKTENGKTTILTPQGVTATSATVIRVPLVYNANNEDVTVTLSNFTDLAGNKYEGTFTIKNPYL